MLRSCCRRSPSRARRSDRADPRAPGHCRATGVRRRPGPNKDKYCSPSNSLKVVQMSPENLAAMNAITLRDLKTLCIQETVRALYRLNKASEALVKEPDIVHSDFLLR